MFVRAERSEVLVGRAEAEFRLEAVYAEVNPCETAFFDCHPECAAWYVAYYVEVCVS